MKRCSVVFIAVLSALLLLTISTTAFGKSNPRSSRYLKFVKKLNKIESKLIAIDGTIEKVVHLLQTENYGNDKVAVKLKVAAKKLAIQDRKLNRILNQIPENQLVRPIELDSAMMSIRSQAESIMEHCAEGVSLLSEDENQNYQFFYDLDLIAARLKKHQFPYFPIPIGDDKVIPVRFVQMHGCFLDDSSCVSHMDRDAIQLTIDGLNEVYAPVGIRFWTKSVERYRATVFANEDLFDEDWICPWDLAQSQLGEVFPIPDDPSPGLTPPRTPLSWVGYMSTRFSETSELLVWLFSRNSLVSRQQDHHSSSTFPWSGRAVILNANNLNDLNKTQTNPSHLIHELGHFFGLPHTWEIPAGYNPETGEPLQWADFWDLAYCESSETFLPNRAVAQVVDCDFKAIDHDLDSDPCEGQCLVSCTDGYCNECATYSCVTMNDSGYSCSGVDPRYDGDSDMECTIGERTFTSGEAAIGGLTFPLGQPETPPSSYAFGVNAMSYLGRYKTDWRTPYRFSDSQQRIMQLHIAHNMNYQGDTYPPGFHSARADLGENIDDYIWWSNGEDLTFAREIKPIAIQYYRPVSGDFDGNGTDDILWYQPGNGYDTIWFSVGNRTWQMPDRTYTQDDYAMPVTGDFDANGADDVLWYVSSRSEHSIWWFETGTVNYSSTEIGINGDFIPVAGDFNGDLLDDIAWYDPQAGTVHLWWFNSSGPIIIDENRNLGTGYIPIVGDFNGDGREDIFWYGEGFKEEIIWWRFGPSTFDRWLIQSDGQIQVVNWSSPIAGDFNGDGSDDIIWDFKGSYNDILWTGDPSRNFTQQSIMAYDQFTPIVGKYDNDNASDIFWYDGQ